MFPNDTSAMQQDTKNQLRVTEIFYSLQGEARSVGCPTIFIRLTGCPLRCQYCDSQYAFYGGERLSIEQILQTVAQYDVSHICVTGGEPLAQPNARILLNALCDKGYQVSLETSGAMAVDKVNPKVAKILDLKTPASGELSKNLWENMDLLTAQDQVKFVIADKTDFDWSLSKVIEYDLVNRVGEVLFSPVHGSFDLADFAQLIIDSGMRIRMQLQLHKFVWDDARGR